MPGPSSGLVPELINLNSDLSATTVIPVAKFPHVFTVVDSYWIVQTALTTANSTTHLRFRALDGASTGSGTASAVDLTSGAWVAYTGRTIGTNYTFAANDWVLCRYSENGTVASGTWAMTLHAVRGNV